MLKINTQSFKEYQEMMNGSLIIILIGTFLTVFTYSMMYPYFAIYLREHLLLTTTSVATIVMVFTGFRRQVVLIGGFLVDRFGHKKMLICGLVIHVLFYLGFAVAKTYYQILFFAIISTLAGALTIPTVKTITAASVTEDKNKAKAFALRSAVYNIAYSLGPVLGIYVASRSYKLLFIACSIAYSIYVLLVAIFIKEVPGLQKDSKVLFKDVVSIKSNNTAVAVLFASVFYYILTSQINATFPIYLRSYLQLSNGQIGMLFSSAAIIAVCFQQIVTHFCSKYGDGTNMLIALVLVTIGIFSLSIVSSIYGVLVSFIIITFSELVAVPILFAAMIKAAPNSVKGTYSGMASFFEGVGISCGVYLGGIITDRFIGSSIWHVLSLIGLILIIISSKYLYKPLNQEEKQVVKL